MDRSSTDLGSLVRWLVFLVVWVVSVSYMASHLNRGWVPHDEGAFGQSAERILNGELPHRDFDEVYTGGLAYVHALALRELGMNLASLRIVLFGAFVVWVPVLFYVASRFMPAYAAGSVTLLAVAWSVPNYAAAVPSWYNLFFAVFGTAALLRHIEAGSRRWLFVAGLCGGLSVLAKISGLYFIAAALLFFLFREQHLENADDRESSGRGLIYKWTTAVGVTVLVGLCFRLVHESPGSDGIIYFVLPIFALAALLVGREVAGLPGRDGKRFAGLLSMIVPFGLGIGVPIAVFLVPYIRSGSVNALLQGVFVLPAKRIVFARMDPPSPVLIMVVLPIFLLTLIACYSSSSGLRLLSGVLLFGGLGAILGFSAKSPQVYRYGWYSMAAAIPVIVVAGAWILEGSRSAQKLTPLRRQQVMLLISVTALTSLVQFPFASPIYYCYVAPIAILAMAGMFASIGSPHRFIFGALIVFYILFAVLRVTPTFIYSMGTSYADDTQIERLTLPRAGGLRIDLPEAQLYEGLIPLVQSHAMGKYIYAAPDCPEVYFLSGLQNPTRTLFDFLDHSAGGNRTGLILGALESHQVNVVAINMAPGFSGLMYPVLRRALEERYPHSAEMGHFQVRWRQ